MMRVRTPAEWEPVEQLLLTWPHAGMDWSDGLDAAQACFANIADAASPEAKLLIAAQDDALREQIQDALHAETAARTEIMVCPSNDVWVRDYGPISTFVDGKRQLIDFGFNAWGGKYTHADDDRVTRRLHQQGCFGDTELTRVEWILEGGALEFDGCGGVLTSPGCLQDTARNADASRERAEALLSEHLGCDTVWWLDTPALAGDDTDGHIDTLARFAPGDVVLHQMCKRNDDPHAVPLATMADDLATLGRGRWTLVPLPLPAPVLDAGGRRLPASYANFLILNDRVLVPTYDDPADDVAVERIDAAFSDHTVIPIDCRALVAQNGSLHCATMQIATRQEAAQA